MQLMPISTVQKSAGMVTCALGIIVLAGWTIGNEAMVRIVPGSVAMTINTALMFVLSGLILLWWHPGRAMPRATRIAAMVLIALPVLILLEHLFDADFGIDLGAFHARLGDGHARPGRTSPNASLCFLLAGCVFLLGARERMRPGLAHAVEVMVAVLTVLGATALLGYLLNLEAMYRIATFNRMAAVTAFGLTVLGMGMWLAMHAAAPLAGDDWRHEDKRIIRLAAILLTIFAIAGGVTGFSVLSHGFEHAMQDNLRQAAARDAFIVSEAIEHARQDARALATNAELSTQLAAAGGAVQSKAALAAVIDIGNRMLPLGFDRIGFYNPQGQLLAWSGRTPAESRPVALSLPLAGSGATLYWQNGFRLRTRTALLHQGQAAGSVVTENRLPTLDALLSEINTTGLSHAMLLCGLEDGRGKCFPSRFSADVQRIPLRTKTHGAEGPIDRALSGKHGADLFKDARDIDVMAGYAPLPAQGLAAIVKVDVSELYAPMRDRLNLLAALLALFVVIGTRLLQRLMQPLVSRILAEQHRMQVMLKHSNDAFVGLDHAGRITDWNERAEKTFGWSAAEVRGRQLTELIVPETERAAVQGLLDGGTDPDADNRAELAVHDRFGRTIPVEMSIGAFRDGRHRAVSAFLRDISDRKLAEKQAIEHAQSMDRARAALMLSQKLEAVGKLTGGVAHDFNNVLQVISGSLQLLQVELAGNERARKRIATATGAVERGAKLSSELLAFARRQPLQPVPTDLARVVRSIGDMLQRALGETITIEIVSPDDLWNALIDPHQIEHVIINLGINARDAMQGTGKLTIAMSNVHVDDEQAQYEPGLVAGDYVALAMTDTGCGMSEETLERVFEPFFTTKPEGQGTGLGLSMAYGFVKQSGGYIRILSKPGEGTTVRIYLPRTDGDEVRDPLAPMSTAVGGTETILVVEDDQAVQETAVDILRELGYRVLQADNGQQALDIVRNDALIDLVFTDVVMPGAVRSMELARQARKLRPGIAVLFASGYTQDAFSGSPPQDLNIHLLLKPYRQEQLARKIRELLDARNGARNDARGSAQAATGGDTPARDNAARPATPASPQELPAPPVPAAPAAVAAPEPHVASEVRVLVVEDNDDFRDLICELLGLLGYTADSARSGEEALRAIGVRRFDILLTDVNLPGMSGVVLAERFRETPARGRVIFSSGIDTDKAPATDTHTLMLRKPYGFNELKAAIEQLLAAPD